jgi:hypothetical protein
MGEGKTAVMTPPSSVGFSIAPLSVEFVLTVIAILLLFAWPRLGAQFFARVERAFVPLARRRGLSVLVVGLTALLLRLAILPVCPIPNPIVPDDFSFLLSADTFAHLRITNPTPSMWIHFESIHITMHPTYMSMYFPAQGLILAAGMLLFGHPWYGLLIVNALMCMAICWMLQAWLPSTWALLGGLLSVLHLALFSYWINTYHAASIAALGGALVLGALPRIVRSVKVRDGILLALGIVILALSRPFEGLLLCLPVAVALGRWAFFSVDRPPLGMLALRAALPLVIIATGLGWLGYFDKVAWGSPFTLPYTVGRAQYATAPYFIWQSRRPEPSYNHPVMRAYFYETEQDVADHGKGPVGYLLVKMLTMLATIQFFAGVALLPPLIMVPQVFRDRRIRFLTIGVLLLAAGMSIQVFLLAHYLAPFTAAFYAIGLQCMRHLRVWAPGCKPFGLTMVRLLVTICVFMSAVRVYAGPLHLALPEWPAGSWNRIWYGPDHFGTERVRVQQLLGSQPGKQLAIVRYSAQHNPYDEWVYNSADIEGSPIIWAREMDEAHNSELGRYYKDRTVWLVQPDQRPALVSKYPTEVGTNAGSR